MSQFTPPPLPHNEVGREMGRETNAEQVDRAERERRNRARSTRSGVPLSLFTGVVVGAVLWLVGEAVFYTGVLGGMTPHPGRWILWFQAAGEVGQALCVGSAAILIGLLAIRRWNAPR